MKINKVHCFFEQSGTFKNEFIKLGVDAEDYDILNDFGETDNMVDLFGEIDKAYEGKPSLFDDIEECDLIFAFYPCTRFQEKNLINFQGKSAGMKSWTEEQKLKYCMDLHEQLHGLYIRICKLFTICLRGGYRMILENPYAQPHYLTMYFPMKPALVDMDRRDNGDYYKKPTQYWYVNCKPEMNLVFEPLEYTPKHIISKAEKLIKGRGRTVNRSLIHPQYASRFIRQHVLDEVNR